MVKRLAALGASLAVALLPAAAVACPQCAGRPGGGVTQGIVIGAFVFLPFAIVATVLRILKAQARVEGGGAALPPARI
jgi:hypothetical protein